MSTVVNNYFENAQLAQAAYAILDKDLVSDSVNYIAKLKEDKANFSASQAAQFASQYSVIDDQQNTDDGFSATLFKDTAGTYTLAIRGTEPPPSLGVIKDLFLTDFGDIGGDGIALKQAVDLFNYYQLLTTDTNSQAMQLEFYEGVNPAPPGIPSQILLDSGSVPKYRYLKVVDTKDGLDLIPPEAQINVTGHSLGGHLALILSRLDPNHIDEVYTYNAPGFDTQAVGSDDTEWFFNTIKTLQVQESGTSTVSENGFPDAKLNNLVIPLDIVSDIGTIPNGQISVFGENSAPSYLAAHGKEGLTDVLAVYNLLTDLSSGQSLGQLTSLFEQGSNQAEGDIEGILNALGDVIGVVGTDVVAGDREQFYKRIQLISEEIYVDSDVLELELKTEYQGLYILVVNGLSDSSHLNNADGFAYRYALENLNPFAITGDDKLYTQHNDGGKLKIDNFTDQYLEDRAAMLAVKNQLFSENATFQYNSNTETDTLFKDLTSEIELRQTTGLSASDSDREQYLFGTKNNDGAALLSGGGKNDHIYGKGGDDTLRGLAGDDYLEGGVGNDHLYGGASDKYADILNGGEGDDTYYITKDDGDTIIRDSDQIGKISFDNKTLGADIKSVATGGGLYKDKAENSYDISSNNLVITLKETGQKIIVEGFNKTLENTLGLTFDETSDALVEPVTTAAIIEGDYEWIDFERRTAGIQEHHDGLGNPIQDLAKPLERVDRLNGSLGNDHIKPGAGNDIVYAKAGDDIIEGGGGTDSLHGGDGNDAISGDAGSDIIYGGAGEDTLYADGVQTLAIAMAATQASGVRGSLISGDDDDDIVIGNVGNDTIFGGGGEDILVGSAGDDNLWGDEYIIGEAGLDWSTTREVTSSIIGTTYISWHRHYLAEVSEDGGDDYLFGGAGDDWLIGQLGKDTLDGGIGNDVLFGDEDDDILIGGEGNDVLSGDSRELDVSLHGNDVLFGGSGDDLLSGNAGNDELYGESGEDKLRGGEGDDTLNGGAGEDELIGGEGDDTLNGGAGEDELGGGEGDDLLDGGTENDKLWGGSGDDTLNGGAGDDILSGGEGDDTLNGGAGDDNLYGNDGDDILSGGQGNDHLIGGLGSNTYLINLGAGNNMIEAKGTDTVLFGAGITIDRLTSREAFIEGRQVLVISFSQNEALYISDGIENVISHFNFSDGSSLSSNDFIKATLSESVDHELTESAMSASGGNFDDELRGNEQANSLFGNGGRDLLIGGAGDDHIYGGTDDDSLYGDSGIDTLSGGKGDDFLSGDSGADIVSGDEGDDQLYGGIGNDVLNGGVGGDILNGGAGDDTINGGQGNDTLSGGEGVDNFLFSSGDGFDLILDADGSDTVKFGAGISFDDITADLVNSTDGTYLGLHYGTNDSVYIKNGYQHAIAYYEFDGGVTFSADELLSAKLVDSIEYVSAGDGFPLFGTSNSDTLTGSINTDTIFGKAGDDLIDGRGGDDWLSGGLGNDTYLLGMGSGQDLIKGEANESNSIRLLEGLTLASLSLERQGQDLFIFLSETGDGVTIEDYYQSSMEWMLEDEGGTQVVLSSLLDQVQTAATAHSISESKNLYIDNVKSYFGRTLLAQGYSKVGEKYILNKTDTTKIVYDIDLFDLGTTDYSWENDIRYDSEFIGRVETEKQVLDTTSATFFRPGNTASGRYLDLRSYLENGDPYSQPDQVVVPAYGTHFEVTGFWIYPAGTDVSDSSPLYTSEKSTKYLYDRYRTKLIHQITSDDKGGLQGFTGSDFKLVDTGAGDDVIYGKDYADSYSSDESEAYLPFTQLEAQERNRPGSWLYGNTGNDHITGQVWADDVLIGGEGNDYLYGLGGDDRYVFFSGDGHDQVLDDVSDNSSQDIVQLPDGVTADDLILNWDEQLAYTRSNDSFWNVRMQSSHQALTLSWGTDDSISIVLPHLELNAGYGIETIHFSDGSEVSFESLVSLAGPIPDIDIHNQDNTIEGVGRLFGGKGDDVITSLSSQESSFDRYTFQTYSNGLNNYGYYMGLDNYGSDYMGGHAINYTQYLINIDDTGNEGEGGYWMRPYAEYADEVFASEFTSFTTLVGGDGNDELIGGEGSDILIGGNIDHGNYLYDDSSVGNPYDFGEYWTDGDVFHGGGGNDV
ncbi:hypothetical protein N9Y67_01795, partial [Pseudomonadota bacterium]|nr:hypothetical protein [Pseudomonadota bacterium]